LNDTANSDQMKTWVVNWIQNLAQPMPRISSGSQNSSTNAATNAHSMGSRAVAQRSGTASPRIES
jgi:hypothetical protein